MIDAEEQLARRVLDHALEVLGSRAPASLARVVEETMNAGQFSMAVVFALGAVNDAGEAIDPAIHDAIRDLWVVREADGARQAELLDEVLSRTRVAPR